MVSTTKQCAVSQITTSNSHIFPPCPSEAVCSQFPTLIDQIVLFQIRNFPKQFFFKSGRFPTVYLAIAYIYIQKAGHEGAGKLKFSKNVNKLNQWKILPDPGYSHHLAKASLPRF